MRINPAGESVGVGPASSAQPNTDHPFPAPAGLDHVELSALSQAASGIGPERLAEMQASVGSGAYEVNSAETSRRIVDFYLIPVD